MQRRLASEEPMYHHVKKLMYTVRVDEPDPRFGNMLLEQFGGANGELAAAMQYSIQGLNCDDPARKDLLMDIGTEELSHLEIVGALARLHLKPVQFDRELAEADPLIAVAGGGGVNLFNSQGNPWTADYLKITGEIDVDLRSNIAAEARAKIVYERLINFTSDAGTRDALQFLMTREIAHMKAFGIALETMHKPRFMIGRLPPTPGLVDQFFNTSTGAGEDGEIDFRGPWNDLYTTEYVEAPAFQALISRAGEGPAIDTRSVNSSDEPDVLEELLAGHLRDLVSTEEQQVRALPRMAEAARAASLKAALELHLDETIEHGERLKGALDLLGVGTRHQISRGMAGLIDEVDQVITDAAGRNEMHADLALIAALQKVEHYEVTAYGTARTLAIQADLPELADVLSRTLAEEEITDNVLFQVARELMSEGRAAVAARQTRLRSSVTGEEEL